MSRLEDLYRDLERDPENIKIVVEILRARMRTGDLAPAHIKWCAFLGDPTCQLIYPDAPEKLRDRAGTVFSEMGLYFLDSIMMEVIKKIYVCIEPLIKEYKLEYLCQYIDAAEDISVMNHNDRERLHNSDDFHSPENLRYRLTNWNETEVQPLLVMSREENAALILFIEILLLYFWQLQNFSQIRLRLSNAIHLYVNMHSFFEHITFINKDCRYKNAYDTFCEYLLIEEPI